MGYAESASSLHPHAEKDQKIKENALWGDPEVQNLLNRFVPIAVLLICATANANGSPRWVSLNGSAPKPPTLRVTEHNSSQTVLQVTLHGYWLEEIEEAGETFQVLSLGDGATTMDIGAPMLPRLVERVAIPARSDLRARVSNAKQVKITGLRLYPFQPPTTDNAVSTEFALDRAAYARNAFFPEEIAAVSQPQIWRDIRLTELHLTPVRYNPVTQEISIAHAFTVTIEYFGVNLHHALDYEPTQINPRYAALYRAGLVNYEHLNLADDPFDLPGTKYLFVMKEEAVAHVQPLIDFRYAQGYKAEVKVFPSQGFSSDVDIKNYISSLFGASGLEYVLLVGDAYYSGGPNAVDVPMHYWVDSFSDSWYVSLQGDDDYYADLAIGRIVYDTMADLDRQIAKTMAYLQNPNTSSNWAHNSLLVAHQEQYPLKYTQCKEQIRTFPYALEVPNFSTAYGGAGATNMDVINYINNNGAGLLNYRGHGSDTEWWQWGPSGSFTAAHVNLLTNVDRYFVHFDVCCDNMNIVGYNGNCLAESFMKAVGAAVAVNGAIIPSYTIPNHDYDREFYKGLFHNGIWNIGYASNYANVTVVSLHGSLGRSNYRTYLWLGDSALDLWTNTPQPLALSYSSTVNLASQDFAVTVTRNGIPVQNALVCAQSAAAYARGFTNGSGTAYLVFSEYPPEPTSVTITATAHNGLPATGTCTIIPAASPYNLVADLTPTSSLTIPPEGGRFTATLDLWNYESYAIMLTGWTDWVDPFGIQHAPFISRYLTIPAGGHVHRNLIQTVAGSEPVGTYSYRVCLGTDPGGSIFALDAFLFVKSSSNPGTGPNRSLPDQSMTFGWDENEELHPELPPQRYELVQHPNPFNSETTIAYALPAGGEIRLTIYDLLGREVAVLADGFHSEGIHEIAWNAANYSSGIYLCVLQADDVRLTHKMIYLR